MDTAIGASSMLSVLQGRGCCTVSQEGRDKESFAVHLNGRTAVQLDERLDPPDQVLWNECNGEDNEWRLLVAKSWMHEQSSRTDVWSKWC